MAGIPSYAVLTPTAATAATAPDGLHRRRASAARTVRGSLDVAPVPNACRRPRAAEGARLVQVMRTALPMGAVDRGRGERPTSFTARGRSSASAPRTPPSRWSATAPTSIYSLRSRRRRSEPPRRRRLGPPHLADLWQNSVWTSFFSNVPHAIFDYVMFSCSRVLI
ncbi:unnamed protein product [Prorocentrum cordatum]|uniref:Uncharacterized protein n=1 Tax=Prorocentrum cordatum TaxID=2364126 RepID=A0ABN9SF19_9DINO|nr:unnamed protein product [Polarella glacialis]